MNARQGSPPSLCTDQTHAALVRSHVHGLSMHRLCTRRHERQRLHCELLQCLKFGLPSVRVALPFEAYDGSGRVRAAGTAILGACFSVNLASSYILLLGGEGSAVGRNARRAEL